jgi:hypothetical protein
MNSVELYEMIRVAYNYGNDIPDSLIAYGIKKFDFAPVVNLYKAGYRVQQKEKSKSSVATAKKSTPNPKAKSPSIKHND